jgi:excisionase family DNA binding protein
MNEKIIVRKLNKIINAVEEQKIVRKKVLSLREACIYLCLSESAIYQKTSKREIPFYRPSGKQLYFKKAELDEWMLQNKNEPMKNKKTNEE